MMRRLLLLHIAVILSVRQSHSLAANAAVASSSLTSRGCADATLADFFDTSEACEMAESLGGGHDCWASLDAVIQRCLDELAALHQHDHVDLIKKSRNKFLGKRDSRGVRNNFLGKRDAIANVRKKLHAFLENRLADETGEKRNRNKFLGKRLEDDIFDLDTTATEKRSRNKFLGKRSDVEDFTDRSRLFGGDDVDKRNRNRFLGKRQYIKRSRNKFLGK